VIKTENVDNSYDVNKAMQDIKTSDSVRAVLPGSIDQAILGTWVCHDSTMQENYIYKFNADGTWEYYVGDVSPENRFYSDSKVYWSVNGNNLERWCSDWSPQLQTSIIYKKNDASTGKPVLIIQFKGAEYRTYFSQDSKNP
jgi:hypothetical protein